MCVTSTELESRLSVTPFKDMIKSLKAHLDEGKEAELTLGLVVMHTCAFACAVPPAVFQGMPYIRSLPSGRLNLGV